MDPLQREDRLTLEDIDRRIEVLEGRIDSIFALVTILMAQAGVDSTHVSVERAAAFKGVSQKTMRRRIQKGEITLETKPGTRESGIPIEQLYGGWIPLRQAREAWEKQKAGD